MMTYRGEPVRCCVDGCHMNAVVEVLEVGECVYDYFYLCGDHHNVWAPYQYKTLVEGELSLIGEGEGPGCKRTEIYDDSVVRPKPR